MWSQLGHFVVYDQTTRSDIRPHIKVGCRPGDQSYGPYYLHDFRGLCGYVWVYGLKYSLCITLTITEPEHCIGGGSSVVQYLKACLERAHVSRFNVTCDVTTVLILFTQSFKVVSVEVRELFFFNWVTNLSDE